MYGVLQYLYILYRLEFNVHNIYLLPKVYSNKHIYNVFVHLCYIFMNF